MTGRDYLINIIEERFANGDDEELAAAHKLNDLDVLLRKLIGYCEGLNEYKGPLPVLSDLLAQARQLGYTGEGE